MKKWDNKTGCGLVDDDLLTETIIQVTAICPVFKLCPQPVDTFKAFELCSPDNLKVVFVGQDPYPQAGVATGILFGNKEGTSEANLSPSLKVIREAVVQPQSPSYKDGDLERFDITLESWAKQGILMINSALTVRANQIGSHKLLWFPFTADLLKRISEKDKGIIFVLFGSVAALFEPKIKKGSNHVIKCRHPAYYARIDQRMTDAPFDEINRILIEQGEEPIKWLKDGE